MRQWRGTTQTGHTHTGNQFEKFLFLFRLGGVASLLQDETEVGRGRLYAFFLLLVDPVQIANHLCGTTEGGSGGGRENTRDRMRGKGKEKAGNSKKEREILASREP